MRKITTLLALLALAGCATSDPKPDTGAYAATNCEQLEAERVRLVAELDALPAGDDVQIEKTRAAIDAVGAAQTEKGCAG